MDTWGRLFIVSGKFAEFGTSVWTLRAAVLFGHDALQLINNILLTTIWPRSSVFMEEAAGRINAGKVSAEESLPPPWRNTRRA